MAAELLTQDDAERRARSFAGWLDRQGATAGDRVAFAAAGTADLVAAAYGALRAGVIPVVPEV
jgi:acyl-CoA synthetase (AMP-forming)/AMP-acid ligase II